MKREVVSIGEEATIQEAARKMAARNLGFLPVCDANGQVLGTITDRDITIRAVAANERPDACRVGQVMTREVVSCRAEDDLSAVEHLMATQQKSRVVVLGNDGRLAGVISLSDLAVHDPGRRSATTLKHVAAREAGRPGNQPGR